MILTGISRLIYEDGYGSTLAMDNLTYNYRAGTNKLTSISDPVASANYPNDIDNQAANNYTYDSIGNLLTDQQAGITANMTWSVYGKLLTISSKSLSYQYDASGNRIGKSVSGTNTWYVRDAQGNVLSTYNGATMALQEQDLYGSSRLGLISGATPLAGTSQFLDALGSGTIFTFTRGRKLFELSNHLGNVLATVSDKKFGTQVPGIPSQVLYYTADVKSAQDYYPGGMQEPGRSFTSSSTYRYGFNGQEKSAEIDPNGNLYNAEYWEYDSRSVRRWNLDPKPSVGISQYSAFSNNPIWFSDALGDTTLPTPSGRSMNIGDNKFETFGGGALKVGNTIVHPANGTLKSFSEYNGGEAGETSRFVATFNTKSGQFAGYVWDGNMKDTYEDFSKAKREDVADQYANAGNILYQHFNSPQEARKTFINNSLGVALPTPILNYTVAASNAAKGVTVVGEGMARVEAVAAKIPGAKILNTMPVFKGQPWQITSQMMQYNRQWLLNELRSGRTILDIGQDVNRTEPSIFYQMEKNMMKNYKLLHP